jgi:trk system potassium uptake protein TrkA
VPTLKRREKLKEALVRAGIASAKTVVVLEERDEDALLVCRLAKELFQVEHIVAWVQDPARMKEFRGLGARPVNPALSTTLLIESLVLHSEAYPSAGDEDAISVRQVKLRSDSLTGCRVDELPLAAGVTVLSIEREGAVLLPDNETRLRKNDTLSLAGSPQGLMVSLQHFNPAAPQ